MASSLIQGQNISLSKENGTLSSIVVGLGWDENNVPNGTDFDLDASCIMLNANNQVPGERYFVFFGNLKSPCGAVRHLGDNLTGKGEGDSEQITVDLAHLDPVVEKLTFVVSIYKALERNQNFGMVRNAYIRIIDEQNKREMARFNLTDTVSSNSSVIFGEVYKRNGEWKFKAVGQGSNEGLNGIAKIYGFDISPINILFASIKDNINSGINKVSEYYKKLRKRFFS